MDIHHLAIDIKAWADEVFPHRTDSAMFLKMYGEIAELIDAGSDHDACADEVADILILVLDYALRKGVNASSAVQRKLAVNRARNWQITSTGVMQHVNAERE